MENAMCAEGRRKSITEGVKLRFVSMVISVSLLEHENVLIT
jgi:hypothetical protein